MRNIYCYFNLFISLCLLHSLVACSSGELSRSNAENLIKEYSKFPIDEIRPFPVTDCSGTVRLETKKYKKLESKGLITYSYEGHVLSCGYAQLTDDGKKFAVSEKYRGQGLNDDTEYVNVKVSTIEFGEIKGIVNLKEMNSAKVEYTVIVKEVTSFGKLFFGSQNGNQGMNALFTKYDDGWRLMKISRGDWQPDSEAPENGENDENEENTSNISNEDYSNMIACNNSVLNLTITGDNVRLRSEPDITRENVVFKLNKGDQVKYLEDKDISGQTWYKVCHMNKICWVSGQFSSLPGQNITNESADQYTGVWTDNSLYLELVQVGSKFRIRQCYGKDATGGGEFWGLYKDNKIVALGNAADFYKFELPTFEKLQNGNIKYKCGSGPYELVKSNFIMPNITYSPPENDD